MADNPNKNQPRFFIDLPTSFSDEWEFIEGFATRKEAIKFCKKHFGADDEGRISLITEVS